MYFSHMIAVVILGAGNVAYHLFHAFLHSEVVNVIQVYNRTSENLTGFSKNTTTTTTNISEIKDATLYIIAVNDDAIHELSHQLLHNNKLVVHTSGSVSMEELATKNRRGVFYPLQTFSKNKTVDFSQIPICIEAENKTDLELLETIAKNSTKKVFHINSKQRLQIHIAAVFVNNFVNHLYKIGCDLCEEENISFEILKPLILETASKIETLSPTTAQTGPAKRNDKKTIKKHLDKLNNHKEMYTLFTNTIIKTYGGKKL